MKARKLTFGMVLAMVAASAPAMADSQFRIRRTTRDDIPFGKGQCDIRLQVDNEVEVAVRRDVVMIRTLAGQEARDDGSECNAPFPDRDLQGFNFEVRDSRNDIRLIGEPTRRNDFTAIVRIRDSSGGFGRYHFRLSWEMNGAGDFRRDDRPGGPPRDIIPPRPPYGGGGGGGGFAWNNAIHFNSRGRGSSTLTGIGSQRLFDATVDIDRGGRVQVSFRTDSGRPIGFTGVVIGRDGDTLKAEVTADERMLRLRGPMFISMDRRENIYRITLDAANGRDRLRLDWDAR